MVISLTAFLKNRGESFVLSFRLVIALSKRRCTRVAEISCIRIARGEEKEKDARQ